MKYNYSFYLKLLLAIVIFYFFLKIYHNYDRFNLKCIISDIDGKEYCVRDRGKVDEAADLLASTTTKCKVLIEHFYKDSPNSEITKNLIKNFNPKTIQETLPTSSYTAYSENKGEKIAFCLNKKKGDPTTLIDSNTLTFVALHELAHLGTTSVGHTPEYWKTFKEILNKAVEIGIYKPVDYKNSPTGYCGMTITDNPIYDL